MDRRAGDLRAERFLKIAMTIAVAAIFSTTAIHAQTMRVAGFVDVDYGWNNGRPASHDNFIPGAGTTAKRANEMALNLAEVELVHEAKPVGFRVSFVTGNGADVAGIHATYEANVSYTAPVGSGLLLQAGIYPSHIGYEGFFSKDNWLYTRSWLGEFSPYYQTGIKAAYNFSDRWSGQLHVLNGWQIVGDNNDAKSIGTQIAYNGSRFSASFNTFVGAELPDDNRHLRTFGDVVLSWKVNPTLSLAASIDRGRQQRMDDPAASWAGVATYANYEFNAKHSAAIRIEEFRDPDNGISGYAQTLREVSAAYLYRPAPPLHLKVELRRDHSTAAVFDGPAHSKSRDQTLLVFGAVVTFGAQCSI
jgi:hypothetical protein